MSGNDVMCNPGDGQVVLRKQESTGELGDSTSRSVRVILQRPVVVVIAVLATTPPNSC